MATAVVNAEWRATGAYLSDEKNLYRVLDSRGAEVLLENCRYPDYAPLWFSVSAVRERMQLVRPKAG